MPGGSRWLRSIAHYRDDAVSFLRQYFASPDRTCLIVAGAGFDPRSATVPKLLSAVMGARLSAVFIREERPNPDTDLVLRADEHARDLAAMVNSASIIDVSVLEADNAVVGGRRAVQKIAGVSLKGFTDVVLDMSALSVGVAYPVADLLLGRCHTIGVEPNLHVVVASHPQLETAITSVPNDVVDAVHGFSGTIDLEESEEEHKVWMPHLAHRRGPVLQLIRDKLRGPVDVCPVLPLSEREPRNADQLISEYEQELYEEWEVDPRNLVYAVEDDPLDLYRTISDIHRRLLGTFAGVTPWHIVLSPLGSKVLAIGSLMAAIEHRLPVRYVEAVAYHVDWPAVQMASHTESRLVHVWLHGRPYQPPAPATAART